LKSIHLIAAARPNFMKVAPLYHALSQDDEVQPILVHTGQHYDANMSGAFLADLGLPAPDHNLGIGSGSHAEQTAGVMVAYETLLSQAPADWVVVVGDVNSTLACSIAAKKLDIPVAHLEAGLRSGDRGMPEEINRIVTDSISDLFWTPSPDADANLLREGIAADRIDRVGNIMIDSYEMLRPRIEKADSRARLGLGPGSYGVVTLHRPSNVDDPATLRRLVEKLRAAAAEIPLVFPLHPRTRHRLEAFGLMDTLAGSEGVRLSDPLGYIDFMGLVREARMVVTDSGGIQEETTYLGIPCLTLRSTTERPVTVTVGTNRLITPDSLDAAVRRILSGDWGQGRRPERWDGRTAGRVVQSLKRHIEI